MMMKSMSFFILCKIIQTFYHILSKFTTKKLAPNVKFCKLKKLFFEYRTRSSAG